MDENSPRFDGVATDCLPAGIGGVQRAREEYGRQEKADKPALPLFVAAKKKNGELDEDERKRIFDAHKAGKRRNGERPAIAAGDTARPFDHENKRG